MLKRPSWEKAGRLESGSNPAALVALWAEVVFGCRPEEVPATASREAAEYFGISVAEVADRMKGAQEALRQHWERMSPDPNDGEQLTRFYNTTEAEVFELIYWHAMEPLKGPIAYLGAALLGRGQGLKRYLDYGAGIGTGALVFGKLGYSVTNADISEPLSAFARWRAERRKINAERIDLKGEELPVERFDCITCFDVLEHVAGPREALRELVGALAPGGLLIVRSAIEGDNPKKPMHIVHDRSFEKPIRSWGMERLWDVESGALADCQVFRSVKRRKVHNAVYYAYDVMLGNCGKGLVKRLREALAGRSGA